MAQDYYSTLGVDRNASEDEIRKAYREMARKYHPDLNQDDDAAKKKFQDVQQAFDVLGDAKKREGYDRFGPAFESMGGGAQGWPGGAGGPGGPGGAPFDFDPSDLFGGAGGGAGGFADLFKQFGGGRGPMGGGRASAPAKGADLEHEITVPFATAVTGGEAAISVRRADGSSETITVKIPAGIEDGKKIRLRGQGDAAPRGGSAGDLLLQVHVAPHPQFTRRGARLDLVVPITLAEAALGAKIDVPTPRGAVTLSVPAGSSSGAKLRIKGQGVEPQGREAGDLYVELRIVLPTDLTEEEREALANLVGDRPHDPRADLRW